MIVDAYNVMHSDPELEGLMRLDLEAARDSLVERLAGYCSREVRRVTLVFDAGGSEGAATSEDVTGNLRVVYTARGQSADDYIERMIYSEKRPFASAVVVTADYAQQRVAQGAGLARMTPAEFLEVLEEAREQLEEDISPGRPARGGAKLADHLPEGTRAALEDLRGRQKHQ